MVDRVDVSRIELCREQLPVGAAPASYDVNVYIRVLDKQDREITAEYPFDRVPFIEKKADILRFVNSWEPDTKVAIRYFLKDSLTGAISQVGKDAWFS